MPLAMKMPETPEELAGFVRAVVDEQMVDLQHEVLAEVRRLGERQARMEGRLEGVERLVEAYREDIKGFQAEIRADQEKFRQEVRADQEKFRQEVETRFVMFEGRLDRMEGRLDRMEGHLDRMEGHLERIEGRLFDMQKALTVQTRWLLTFLVAVPVIYSLLQKLL
ncbi:MAG: hypothetical protein V3S24_16020, partial [Candidatus Tectomicrobia bacterium]